MLFGGSEGLFAKKPLRENPQKTHRKPEAPKGIRLGGKIVNPEAVSVLMYASAREGRRK